MEGVEKVLCRVVTPEMVFKVLSKLDPSSTLGVDWFAAAFCRQYQQHFSTVPGMDVTCAPLKGWGRGLWGGLVNCDMSQKIQ